MCRPVGFTLIETMIVLAILSVILAVILPIYQDYVAKSQIGAALYEIRAGQTTIEYTYQDGGDVSLVDADYVGLKSSKRCLSVAASLSSNGLASISCVLSGNAKVNGRNLTLRRSLAGVWTCDAGEFSSQLRPSGCL
ncbi:pilin [Xanthomonas phaseoli]|uniref:pilin n=1 Tax=Xanthomonas phaseoli TaxID=1985254 RepID=UPI003AFFD24C